MASAYDIPGLYDYLTRFSGQDEVLAQVARETARAARRRDAIARRPGRAADDPGPDARRAASRSRSAPSPATARSASPAGWPPDGHLTCFEVDEEYAEISRRNIARAGLDDRVTVQLGPAAEGLAQLPDEPHVDLAYVDADKTGYPAYYDALVPRLRPGGVLVLDNTLLRGRVLDPQDERARRWPS